MLEGLGVWSFGAWAQFQGTFSGFRFGGGGGGVGGVGGWGGGGLEFRVPDQH